ncbi:hypothetical protein B7P43_G16484 [Cryptotermes secundus]|uniref:Uncharacterized protein n=1 Tax=Cryptotermes secundus TaxID=105785 RepID=A0A2J7PGX5_9NEOP|nr:zinc finger protein 436 [Cryptotermes secundus]PNF15584.1 hypothetical protein B7P43_G16484 [Cryptotermes secundus]
MSPNFTEICRLCMIKQEDTLLPLFDENNIFEKIKVLIPHLELCIGDGLPAQVCPQCVHQINTSYSFKLQCEASDATLRKLLVHQETQPDIKEDIWNCQHEVCMFVEVKEENKYEECSNHVDTSDRLHNDDTETSLWPGDCYCKINEIKEEITREVNENSPADFSVLTEEQEIENDTEYYENTTPRGVILPEEPKKRDYPRPYCCEICGLCFTQKNKLAAHLNTHSGEKPYPCKHCGMKFSRPDSCRSHLLCHSGQRPYSCELCNKTFTRHDTMKRHLYTHTGYKPHQCTLCSKSFIQKAHLKIHLASHTDYKPFQCQECPKTFSTHSRLKEHAVFHTGKWPHACEYCSKGFARKDHLKKHYIVHKKKNVASDV